MIRTIAFDADDTLWHNEVHFNAAQEKFRALLRPFHPDDWIDQRLFATEMRNLAHFGYGIKSFTLSLIETAIELSEGRIPARDIQVIVDLGKEMLAHPVELLPGVCEALDALEGAYRLMVITKGDLFDQEAKLARSGIGDRFQALEVVSEKDEGVYRGILERHGIAPAEFLMVGNSVKSDVLPVLALGGRAVHVPYFTTWAHEVVEGPLPEGASALVHLGQLPDLLRSLG